MFLVLACAAGWLFEKDRSCKSCNCSAASLRVGHSSLECRRAPRNGAYVCADSFSQSQVALMSLKAMLAGKAASWSASARTSASFKEKNAKAKAISSQLCNVLQCLASRPRSSFDHPRPWCRRSWHHHHHHHHQHRCRVALGTVDKLIHRVWSFDEIPALQLPWKQSYEL